MTRTFLPLGAALAFLIAAAVVPRTTARADEAALAVIVHPSNARTRIDASMLKQIFTRQLQFWPGGGPIVPINFPPGDPIRTTFDQSVLGMSPDRASQFWIDQMVRGRGQPPRKLASAGLAVRVVQQLAGAIAYVPSNAVTGEVHVAAYVKGGKVVAP